jgi:hypothetical protein
MPSILNSDDGVVSGTSGLKTTGGNDGLLNIQTNGSTAMSINASQQVTFNNGANLPNTFGFKNRLINGEMDINQRAVTSVPVGTEIYTLDRWIVANYFSSGAISVAQSSDAPAGFNNSILITNGTGEALSSGDFGCIRQKVEGFNVADFAWGTASASPITISFWVKSSVTGNYNITLINGAVNRSNRSVFTINAANTWEYKTITIAGDTSGTWATNNSIGLYFDIVLVAGSSQYGTADTWTANSLQGVSGAAATWVTSTNATFYATGAQIERGRTATSWDFRSIGTELALCQRYAIVYGRDQNYNEIGGTGFAYSTTKLNAPVSMPVQMRSTPTISYRNKQLDGCVCAAFFGVINV